MKRLFLILIVTFYFVVQANLTAYAQNLQSVKQTLTDWNEAIMYKDIEKAISVFDDNANVIVIGSGKEEVHKGNAEIRKFLERFFTNPFSASWDMSNVSIDSNKKTAWAFVNGEATIKGDDGSIIKMPYRITVVMVWKGATWKWRLFNGSVPEKD
ncbi:YybH family protein [Rufibacter hautae]|uniref:Nuclear transport factor 2 family protein n=1 Tax=Rufibacter hautae TaxID=2595005 RepID=A0A5B6TB01_9BACT|nr:nuclear transport factor 2 family protein [Rufibacter hautae]KAA3437639.1 nuclear transport factor 2 family protein [Rufibacter hautae]